MYYLAQVYKNLGEFDFESVKQIFFWMYNHWKDSFSDFFFYNTVICHTGETERAATYCHSTLQRQLQLNQFNPMEWALNAATLSQYYITKVGQML